MVDIKGNIMNQFKLPPLKALLDTATPPFNPTILNSGSPSSRFLHFPIYGSIFSTRE